jgi:ADP-ribosylation factor related protein 1
LLLSVSKCDLKGIQCQFWDLGGGGDLPKLWPKYYKESHAVLFVIDSIEFKKEKEGEGLKETFSKLIIERERGLL